MWASGVAGGAAAVSWWRVIGPGFVWLAGGITLLVGAAGLGVGAGSWAAVGTAATVVAIALGRSPDKAGVGLALASLGYLIAAAGDGGLVPSATGALLLGGVTTEMLLGHWYLVDPRLPRWALRRLDFAAGIGVLADAASMVAREAFPWAPGDDVIGWGYVAVAVATLVLMTAVWFSLGERGYSGVMAATGLSYLAVLTAFGT
ncbi:MAG: hypothetical protein ACE5KX_04765, partial [Acidimicrobiia bacterium]